MLCTTGEKKKKAGRARVVLSLSCTPPVQCRVKNRLAGWKVHCKLSCLFLLLNLSDIWLTLLWTQPPRPPSSHPSPAGSCQPKTLPLIPFSLTLLNGAGAGTEGQAQRESPSTGEIIVIYALNFDRTHPQQRSSTVSNIAWYAFKLISFPKAGWHPHCTPTSSAPCRSSKDVALPKVAYNGSPTIHFGSPCKGTTTLFHDL